MDNIYEENNHNCDLPQQKRRPAPIVSLGKIIGYKLACIGVTIKTMDVFNSPPLRKLLFKTGGRKLRKTDKKPKDTKVKRSVSFSDIVEEKTIDEMTDDRHDTNVNASQGKGSDTSISSLRKAVNTRHFSYQQKSPITKSCHKAAPIGKIKGASCLKPRNVKLKTKTDVNNDLQTILDQKSLIKTRSTSALTSECHSVSTLEHPSNKSSETFVVALSTKHKKRTLRNRRAEILKGDTIKTFDEKTQAKGGKASRKTRNMDWTLRKRNHRFDNDKLHDLPSSSRKCSLVPVKNTSKPKPLPTVSNKSPLKSTYKRPACNRRWADVVAGTSRNIDDLIQSRSNIIKSKEVQEKDKIDGKKYFTGESTHSKEDDTACSKITRRSSRTQTNENMISDESSYGPINKDQDNCHPYVKDGETSYQDDFPSLQELKSKNQKRAKWCQRQKEENHDNCIKTTSKQRRRVRKDHGSHNILERSKRQKRNKPNTNKNTKKQNKVTVNIDKTDGETSHAEVIRTDKTTKDSSYIIGNIQEVVIQPVGRVCPLDEEIDCLQRSDDGESNHFTLVTLSPHKDNTRNDICSKLDAMSVNGNLECCSSSNPDGIGAAKADVSKGDKSPRVRIPKNLNKSKLDEPGPSQKKISARYRALLRRDHGKVDAKRATEIFNCGRWVDLHQREKIYDRFDVHQQRRNQRRRNSNDPEGVSQLLNTFNTLYYCVPQNNNECPIM